MPEPFVGPLSHPRLVLMGQNPGGADLGFQGTDGLFAREIIDHGGFTAWARTDPYARDPWTAHHGRNRYLANRAGFASRWLGDDTVRTADLLVLELFPWHSAAVTGPMRPESDLIREFVWEPAGEIDVEVIFAFGKPWAAVADALGLREIPVRASFAVASRRLRTFCLPTGQTLAVLWHSGSAGPPGAADTEALRQVLPTP